MNKISIKEIKGNYFINMKGDFIDNLIQLGILMNYTSSKLAKKYFCSSEDAISFIQDLPNKLKYNDENSDSLIFEVLKEFEQC